MENKKERVGVLTMTYFRSTDELRFHLACQTIGNAAGAGHNVMLLEGSPNAEISEAIGRHGVSVKVEQTAKGMGLGK